MRKVSAIIPTYNRCQFIGITLESLINQDYPAADYEIIVVDNNSSDDTKKVIVGYAKNERRVKIRYILEKRLGLHYARNTAAQAAKHPLLYFADDDIIAEPNMLKEIIRPLEIDPEVATATGRILPKWEQEPPAWVKRLCNNALLSLMDPPEDLLITKKLNFLYGCHQLVRRDVFFAAEGSNPDTFGPVMLGDGEAGLNKKISDLGKKFAYNGQSLIYHIMPPARTNQNYLNKRLGNSGAGHAYRSYRQDRPSAVQLFFINLRLIFVSLPTHFLTYAGRTVIDRDFQLTRFFIAYTYYYRNRVRYNNRLIKSSAWRAFTLKNDWLTNDTKLKPEISEFINNERKK